MKNLLRTLVIAALTTACTQGTTNSTSALTLALPAALEGVVYVGELFYLEASGGAAPYAFSKLSGDGTLESDTGYFQVSDTTGYVEILVTDAKGATARLEFFVSQASTSSDSSTDTDAEADDGDDEIADTEEEGDYEILSESKTLALDHKVGVAFDLNAGASHPRLLIWGTGSGVAEIGKNLNCGSSSGNLKSPCAIEIKLENMDNNAPVDRIYLGRLRISGRSNDVELEFCIAPGSPDRAYTRWVESYSLVRTELRYSSYGSRVAGGQLLKADFNTIDSNSGTGNASVELSEARYIAGETECGSDFSASRYLRTSP